MSDPVKEKPFPWKGIVSIQLSMSACSMSLAGMQNHQWSLIEGAMFGISLCLSVIQIKESSHAKT